MSSYLSVYYHDQEHGSYISLGSFSRHTEIYKAFNDNGYSGINHKIMPITVEDIQNIVGSMQIDIDYYEKQLAKIKRKSQKILNLKGHTIKEKMEAIEDNEEYVSDYETELKSLDRAQGYLVFLQDVIENNQFAHKGMNGNTATPDRDRLIYCGIDCDCPIDYHWD